MLSLPVIFPCDFCHLLSSNRTEKRFSKQMPAMQVLKKDQQQRVHWICRLSFSITKIRFHFQCPCPPQSALICTDWAGLAPFPGYWHWTVPHLMLQHATCSLRSWISWQVLPSLCCPLPIQTLFCTALMDSATAQYTVGTVQLWTVPTALCQRKCRHKFSEVLAYIQFRKNSCILIPIFFFHCQFSF